jgi:hypothetical protein
MTNLRILIKSSYLSAALSLVTALGLPALNYSVAAADDCVPVTYSTGVHQPNGADAAAYTYDCPSNLWISAHFTYNPATGLTTANDPVVYTYNPATGAYESTYWVYNTPTANYVARTLTVITPPAGATVIGAPAPAAPTDTSISNTGPDSSNNITNDGGVTSGSAIAGTGPNSSNTIGGSSTNTVNGTNTTTAGLNNTITATATSGNALTLSNTTAGGAASGNAQDIANVVNLLQSSSNALDGNTVTFVANIDGDVNGDLLFDPAQIGAVQPAGITSSPTGTNNLNLNNTLDAGITNNINLTANSGDASVSNNTSGGDATTGSATTIANVVNLINSAITSGKSFLGVVNINGNLNGDILIPANFVDQLVAANTPTVSISTTGPGSTNAIETNTGSNNTTVTNTNNQGITNNVNAGATSGSADVSSNTSGGSATSGSAKTNITAFNLTGSQVIGANSLLVFVNVLGEWVGLIVNAPPGTTAAELGGGITQNTSQANNNTDITNTGNQNITNNITTAAASGDASVTHNTRGGNAKSGNANGAVNLLNVENSSLSLSNWFGILFINVFGTWHGSFGMNTAAGDAVVAGRGADGTSAAAPGASFAPAGQFASFVPTTAKAKSFFTVTGNSTGGASSNPANSADATNAVNAVLAASTLKGSQAPTPQLQDAHSTFRRTAIIIGLCTLLFIVADAANARRKAA